MDNVVEFTGTDVSRFHQKVAGNVSAMGHKHTPGDANPDDKTPLHKIAETIRDHFGGSIRDARYAVDNAGVFIQGEEPGEYNRGADNSHIIDLAEERQRRRNEQKKAA